MALLPALCAGCFAMAQAASIFDETELPPDVAAFLSAKPDPTLHDAALEEIKIHAVPALRNLAANPALIDALRDDNAARITLTAQEISTLGHDWRKAVATRDWAELKSIIGSPASKALRTALENMPLATARIYVSDSRNLLTAATMPVGVFELGDWGGWRRIYMSSPETAFIETTDIGDSSGFYRIEIGIWDPVHNEAIGTLIAEIPEETQSQSRLNDATSSTSADHRN